MDGLDGKNVPTDAIPGVTEVKWEGPFGESGLHTWRGLDGAWNWSNFGKELNDGRIACRYIAYRNPRAASTEAGMAMLREIADRVFVGEPVIVEKV